MSTNRNTANSADAHREPRILVVDDEVAIADLLYELLSREGMHVRAVTSGPEALELVAKERFDLVVLDIMMPGMDGFDVCRQMRSTREMADVPIIFLSARDDEADRVVGLTIGGDDFVAKPFRPREFVARVKVRLRRSDSAGTRSASSALEAGGISVDVEGHSATLHDVPLHLTPKEFEVLALLVAAGGSPVPARELYEQVWGERFSDAAANSVMVHIRNLRKKLAAVDSSEEFIVTAWGVGYRIAVGRG